MRIVVFGANGRLGSSLVPYLRAQGHEVICSSCKTRSELLVDLTDLQQVRETLNNIIPEVVVNLAALTDVDRCEQDVSNAYLINIKIVENLARWINDVNKLCHLVQISTDQVYDGAGPHNENDITITNCYALSKYAGELVASLVHNSTIIRTNFFGPSLCQSKTISDWIIQSLLADQAITVYEDIKFSPLSLQHLVEILVLVISGKRRGTFNVGSKDGMSKADFAFTLAHILGLPTHNMRRGFSFEGQNKAYRPKDMCMDSSRFEFEFGIVLPTLIEEINSMKEAYRK